MPVSAAVPLFVRRLFESFPLATYSVEQSAHTDRPKNAILYIAGEDHVSFDPQCVEAQLLLKAAGIEAATVCTSCVQSVPQLHVDNRIYRGLSAIRVLEIQALVTSNGQNQQDIDKKSAKFKILQTMLDSALKDAFMLTILSENDAIYAQVYLSRQERDLPAPIKQLIITEHKKRVLAASLASHYPDLGLTLSRNNWNSRAVCKLLASATEDALQRVRECLETLACVRKSHETWTDLTGELSRQDSLLLLLLESYIAPVAGLLGHTTLSMLLKTGWTNLD